MRKLTERQIETLRDVLKFDKSGYYLEWRPKTIEQLAKLGLVTRSGAGHRITPAGLTALKDHSQ